MGKNTKYIEVDQLNLNATRDRTVASSFNTLDRSMYGPKLSCMSKEDRRKEIWGMIIGLSLTFGPFILIALL